MMSFLYTPIAIWINIKINSLINQLTHSRRHKMLTLTTWKENNNIMTIIHERPQFKGETNWLFNFTQNWMKTIKLKLKKRKKEGKKKIPLQLNKGRITMSKSISIEFKFNSLMLNVVEKLIQMVAWSIFHWYIFSLSTFLITF